MAPTGASYDSLAEAIRREDQAPITGASLATLHIGLQLDAFAPANVPVVVRITLGDEEAKPGMIELYEMMKGGGLCTMLVAQIIALNSVIRPARAWRRR